LLAAHSRRPSLPIGRPGGGKSEEKTMSGTRRQFLAEVGKGALLTSLGSGLAAELGLTPAQGAEVSGKGDALAFGAMEPLVCLMQETAPERLLPILTEGWDSHVG
jgi:hypothetical protein